MTHWRTEQSPDFYNCPCLETFVVRIREENRFIVIDFGKTKKQHFQQFDRFPKIVALLFPNSTKSKLWLQIHVNVSESFFKREIIHREWKQLYFAIIMSSKRELLFVHAKSYHEKRNALFSRESKTKAGVECCLLWNITLFSAVVRKVENEDVFIDFCLSSPSPPF